MTDDGYRAFASDGVEKFSRRPLDEQRSGEAFAGGAVLRQRPISTSPTALPDARRPARHHRARARPAGQSHLLPRRPAVACSCRPSSSWRARGSSRPRRRPRRSRGSSSRSRSATTSRAPRRSTTRSPQVFDERQIFRIDHYLGKETVQNILVLRFANSFFEPLFNQQYIDHVQITVAEAEGVGTRAGYYEQAGALRDMVQNHLLQLLALVAMEPPLLARRRRRPRREAARSSSRCGRSTGDDVDRRRPGAVRRRRRRRPACPGTASEAGVAARLAHRDVRRPAGVHRQLALGRRAVLPAHRQAAARSAPARSRST